MIDPLLERYFDSSLDVLLSAGAKAIYRQADVPVGDESAVLRAVITFPGPSYLSVRLLVNVYDDTPLPEEYSFHYMDDENATIFRYDNSDNHPGLPYVPHHKHEGADERVVGCPQPSVSLIRDEIEAYLKGLS